MNRRAKKRIIRTVFLFISLVIIGTGAWMIYQRILYNKAKFTRYPEFGIAMPEAYDIHGIDVSRYQHIIAWEEVKAMKVKNISVGFAFIKATEGIANTDQHFRRNWKKAKDNDIARGAYHFFIASKDGRMQAENFIDRVKLQTGDLPPVLDIEQLNGTAPALIRQEAKEWLEIVENYYGVRPIIYTNVDFYNRYLGKDFDKYPLWVAHYYQSHQPRISRNWAFWQHSDEGRVNGITSAVDFNVFSGDSIEFSKLLIK
ncbi:MAG TPA: glycoside hydrolase family 25 protein [Chitinophagaceae bacterium]